MGIKILFKLSDAELKAARVKLKQRAAEMWLEIWIRRLLRLFVWIHRRPFDDL